jgi:hypothetical protein
VVRVKEFCGNDVDSVGLCGAGNVAQLPVHLYHIHSPGAIVERTRERQSRNGMAVAKLGRENGLLKSAGPVMAPASE